MFCIKHLLKKITTNMLPRQTPLLQPQVCSRLLSLVQQVVQMLSGWDGNPTLTLWDMDKDKNTVNWNVPAFNIYKTR